MITSPCGDTATLVGLRKVAAIAGPPSPNKFLNLCSPPNRVFNDPTELTWKRKISDLLECFFSLSQSIVDRTFPMILLPVSAKIKSPSEEIVRAEKLCSDDNVEIAPSGEYSTTTVDTISAELTCT